MTTGIVSHSMFHYKRVTLPELNEAAVDAAAGAVYAPPMRALSSETRVYPTPAHGKHAQQRAARNMCVESEKTDDLEGP